METYKSRKGLPILRGNLFCQYRPYRREPTTPT